MTPKNESTQHDNTKGARIAGKIKGGLAKLLLPLFLLLFALSVPLMPKTATPINGTTIKAMSAAGFPVTLVLEQNDGMIQTAWLCTPAGTREIDNMNGLSFVSEGTYISKKEDRGREELLWRTSFTNLNGNGIHLWIGVSPQAAKAYVATTPYNYTKWDNVPAKLTVPRGTAVYISPALLFYEGKEPQNNRENYSFVYTIKMTPQGPAFVPAAGVYRQLSELLQAGIRGEHSPLKRLAYARMLEEFNKLADGNPPSTQTLLRFPISKIATISWR